MSNQPRIKPKPRIDDALAKLAKRMVGGEPAGVYLFRQLGGEDGDANWTYDQGAEWASKRLGVRVGRNAVFNWFQKRAAVEAQERYFAIATEVEMNYLEKNPHVDPVVLANATIAASLAQIITKEDPEIAVKVINAMTSLKKAWTDEARLEQRVKEYEESVGRLKGRIDLLTQELKTRGFDPAALDELNKRTVSEIDDIIRGTGKK
jgi:hypothetical protein